MKNKQLILSVLLLLGIGLSGLQAQTMYVLKTSGEQTSYTLNNIQKLTFSDGDITVSEIGGTSTIYAIAGLRYLSFADLNIPVALNATDITPIGFTANWNTVSGADNYLLYVSADNFSTYLPTYDGLLVTGTSKIIDGLLPETTYSYKLKSQNTHGITGFSNTISVTTLQTVKVENMENLSLSIYPNPASQEIVIQSGNETLNSISIIDLQGKVLMNLMLTINPNESQVIDISTITKGCYFVIATCNDGSRKITKLIIE